MTTWPSATKASTTHVDAGTDQISLARADIKQNIDNVNDIIDIFNIASPTNGDLMQYSSSTTKWEKVASTTIGNPGGSACLIAIRNTASQNVVSDTYRRPLEESSDPSGLVTLTGSDYQFTLVAGTYLTIPMTTQKDDGQATAYLYNETDSTTALSSLFQYSEVGNTNQGIYGQTLNVLTIAATKTFSIRQDAASAGNRDFDSKIIFLKIF